MAFYHGTSAASALKIAQSGTALPSNDGFFYCFDSTKPESLAGALCFATGDGPRNGSLTQKDFFSRYAKLNPDYPRGLKGAFVTTVLKRIAASWCKDQMKSATSPLDRQAAILVFDAHPDGIPQSRQGFVNEVQVPAASLSALKLQRVYIDDTLLTSPDVEQLKRRGIPVEPLSACALQVMQDCESLKAAKKSKKAPGGPN